MNSLEFPAITMKRDHEQEGKDALVEIGYDALNTIPLVGTLAKAAVRLFRVSQKRRIELFAHTIHKGLPVTDDLLSEMEEKHTECFGQLFQSLLSDHEEGKAPVYAYAFLFLTQNDLFAKNKPLAEYIVRATKELTLRDNSLITEIDAMLQRKDPLATNVFFQSLEYTKSPGDHFDWHRRLSVQNLTRLGLLAKIRADSPIWSTEHFDIMALVVQGLNDHRSSLISDNVINR